MAEHEGSSIPNYSQLSLPFVNTNGLGWQDLSLGSQWLQSGYVPMKSEEMVLAVLQKGISKGTGHSLTFRESQKRRWGIYLLEAWQLLQEVHQSARQKAVEKRLFPKVMSLIQASHQAMEVLAEVSCSPGRSHCVLGREGKAAAGFSGKVSLWLKYCRETAEDPGAHTKF